MKAAGEWLKGSPPGAPRTPATLCRLLGAALALGLTALLMACSIPMTALEGTALHRPRSSLELPQQGATQPVLTEEEMQRGTTYYGSGTRLRALAHKLLQGRPVKVYLLGGSVTVSGNLHPLGLSYAARLFQWINTTFPSSDHVFSNGGQPGSSSSFFAPCLDRWVAQDADLVVLEFAINDPAFERFNSPSRRAYEQLIRRLLALPGQPAVMLLHHYAWWMARGDGRLGGLFYAEPEAQHTTFAHYYDLPSVSLRAAAWRLMEAGVKGFKVDKLLRRSAFINKKRIPRASMRDKYTYLYSDIGHPGIVGQQALAELLVAPLTRAVREAAAGLALARREDERLEGLPPPMIPHSPADGAASVCAMLEDFKGVVTGRSGFEYVAHRPEEPTFASQKWSWKGTRPGDWVEMEVDTLAEGAHPRSMATVLLVHLRSYEDMGLARLECVAGCACPPATFDTLWSPRVSIFTTKEHKVTQHRRCRLRVTIEDEPGRAGQQAHKVSLTGLIVTH